MLLQLQNSGLPLNTNTDSHRKFLWSGTLAHRGNDICKCTAFPQGGYEWHQNNIPQYLNTELYVELLTLQTTIDNSRVKLPFVEFVSDSFDGNAKLQETAMHLLKLNKVRLVHLSGGDNLYIIPQCQFVTAFAQRMFATSLIPGPKLYGIICPRSTHSR